MLVYDKELIRGNKYNDAAYIFYQETFRDLVSNDRTLRYCGLLLGIAHCIGYYLIRLDFRPGLR